MIRKGKHYLVFKAGVQACRHPGAPVVSLKHALHTEAVIFDAVVAGLTPDSDPVLLVQKDP